MRPLVLRSLNDGEERRCVDLRRAPDGRVTWAECRRDPEDAGGWRVIRGGRADGFADEAAALADASAAVGWLRETHSEFGE